MLKAFAGDARRQLLSEVRARLELVLAEGSTQRHEYAAVIAKLETAIHDGGGGEAGRVAVVDRVAYTWFNRIIALRFMDANSYTGIGVVSPSVDRPDGQPEVLVDAKRGDFDADVVAPADVQRITGLLNGSVTSSDPESEAFGLLLAAYCRFWNKSMPFMFEQNPDYTELLMPSDLLSDESVIARAVAVLTPDVCADVEVIGWLYQFYIAERKDEVFAGFKAGKKAGAAEIPAATQLFTPDWIVCYLVENSLGRLWLLNRPDSNLADKMEYYIAPLDEETDFLRIESPEDIKVMDPACGSGHMLTYAFDLLYLMYEEDGYNPAEIPELILAKNLYGTEIDPRAGVLAAFALTMKARARQRTFPIESVTPSICVLEPVAFSPEELDQLVSRDGNHEAEEALFTAFGGADTFGALVRPDEDVLAAVKGRLEALGDSDSLFRQDLADRSWRVVTQAEYLTSRYHVVVANPPYMGSKSMDARLSEWAKRDWPTSKADLFAMFIERCGELVAVDGFAGLITMQSWMYLSSYRLLRQDFLTSRRLITMAHLGTSAFESIGGEVVSTTSFVWQQRPSRHSRCTFVDLTGAPTAKAKRDNLKRAVTARSSPWVHESEIGSFNGIPGSPLAYWLSDSAVAAFTVGPYVRDFAEARVGMATGDNERFVRLWFEVDRGQIGIVGSRGDAKKSRSTWFPYANGGASRRWFGNLLHVVNWFDDGRQLQTEQHPSGRVRAHNFNLDHIFAPGITWSLIGNGYNHVRQLPPGCLFSSGAPTLFGPEAETLLAVAGLCNSIVGRTLLAALNPTLNSNPGDVENLPFPFDSDEKSRLAELATELISIAEIDWNTTETSMDFETDALVNLSSEIPILESAFEHLSTHFASNVASTKRIEEELNALLIARFDLEGSLSPQVSERAITLSSNPVWALGEGRPEAEYAAFAANRAVRGLVSYAVGCMFGRYSLNKQGVILANQGESLGEYLAQVPEPSFMPDGDNVIPVLADDWFDDDIVERFRLFLRIAFGEDHFEENLRFVEEALGKDIRRYFLTDFYNDHVQRYKKRPIYWMFSSPKGTFNALIYMHRYNPSTVSTVLNEYLREFQAKLEAELNNQGRIAADPSTPARDKARAEKESDKLRKMIAELRDYEHDVLYPLASQQTSIDLDDGVKANYPKFGTALKKIPGLEAAND